MLAEYKTKTKIGLATVVTLQCIGFYLGLLGMAPNPILGTALSLCATIVLIIACSFFAIGKGYRFYFGLLGLLWAVGLIILFVMPDKNKEEGPLFAGKEATIAVSMVIFFVVIIPILLVTTRTATVKTLETQKK